MIRRLTTVRATAALTLILLIAATTASLSSPADAPAAPAVGARPLIAFSGPHSAITDRRHACITTKDAWEALWIEHAGDDVARTALDRPICPTIDFDRCLVIAVFQGDAWNSDGMHVETITEREDDLLIRYDSAEYQTLEQGVRVRPFGIWVLPRTGKPIVLEENVQGIIGRPPQWEQQARFTPVAR